MRRSVRATVAIGVGLATTLGLAIGHHQVGYVRDEGIYFEAGRRYADWTIGALKKPTSALDPIRRDRAFGINREHPALMKLAGGLSGKLLAKAPEGKRRGGVLPWIREGAAMRLPAQILAGIGVALLFLVGASVGGITAGLLAAGWFVLLPRVAFHAGLATFDVPVAVAALVVVLVYRRAFDHPRWGWVLGPILGVAIAIKHNALFFVGLLVIHYYGALAWGHWGHGLAVTRKQLVPLPFVSMALGAPLVAWLLWPWLWHDPWTRVVEYFAFHRNHPWYNMEFWGENYNLPPLPVSYPFVMTWATVPTTFLVLAIAGLGVGWVRDCQRSSSPPLDPSWSRPLPRGWPRLDAGLVTLFAAFPLVLIALPRVPIFGGTKHWLTAYPFLAWAAAWAWAALWTRLADRPKARAAVLSLCLLPATLTTVRGHPYNLSQYAPLVGGPRGAARLGLNRGFWGHAVLPLLPAMQEVRPDGASLDLHDLHPLVQRQYVREGRWPRDIEPVPRSRADLGLLFHELHMTTDEIALWNRLGTNAPVRVVHLHDVPLTSLYASEADR